MITEPRCFTRGCRHFRGVVQPHGDESVEFVSCDAYPIGIPKRIAYGKVLHLKPHSGDHGIQYEKEKVE